MIDKYYNGVIEQVYSRVGKEKKNIVMACYSNDFSIADLDNIKLYQKQQDKVFFTWHEFGYRALEGAYEPFLDTLCEMFRTYDGGDFNDFLQECEVYELHRSLLLDYYEKGECCREESVLLNEVEYEQYRMTKAIADMLKNLAGKHPVVIVINRFQLAGKSTMELVHSLLTRPSENIGLVLGVNEMQPHMETSSEVWSNIVECLEDSSHAYHIGSSGRKRKQKQSYHKDAYALTIKKLYRMQTFLDYDQVQFYCQDIEHKLSFEDVPMDESVKRDFYLLYASNSILLAELSKALELIDAVQRMHLPDKNGIYHTQCALLKATCFMYQGKLEQAEKYAKIARAKAEIGGDEKLMLRAELLGVMTRMSGWYNIFFCVQDIPVEEVLLRNLEKYNFKNHLAHIYIYAYDNRPEVVEKAYRTRTPLFFYGKGMELAKEIGNEQLVEEACQKNIMLASTNGMNEISMTYSVRSFLLMKDKNGASAGRIFSGMGYNLSALGWNEEADKYFNRAIEIFYRLRLPEDIAEVYYNRSMNNIMKGNYVQAEHDLQIAMKVIERLHLNSLRVCNMSKMYALLALTSILQKDRFNCDRYLLSCRQFLNYIIEKEKEKKEEEIIHDYAMCDDDMFLYSFALGLLNKLDGDHEEALSNLENAEVFLSRAEGNQFFCYRLFREARMELYRQFGMEEQYEQEKSNLLKHEGTVQRADEELKKELLEEVELGEDARECHVSVEEVEALIKQEGVTRDYLSTKREMEFVSAWQKMIDVSDMNLNDMVQNAIRTFINHFSLDRALYICFQEQGARVFYNDTGKEMTEEVLTGICSAMKEYPQGFAVSKISDSFLEHQDVISFFGVDEVCSFAAVPFKKNGIITSLLITYVRMKDNWHGSIERYMLNEDDLDIYKLLFREMEYAINRLEANLKIHEMNRKLQETAVTDMLTGIYNRAGMYEKIQEMTEKIRLTGKSQRVGLMFIDLDNFKPYNDTYGHEAGDIILREMAGIFQQASEGFGFVSRFGGDEFIVILNTDDKGALEHIAKDIYRRIEAAGGFQKQIEEKIGHSIQLDQNSLVTCSIGIARAGEVCGEEDINELIRRADDLLYFVKTGEKGHYAFL